MQVLPPLRTHSSPRQLQVASGAHPQLRRYSGTPPARSSSSYSPRVVLLDLNPPRENFESRKLRLGHGLISLRSGFFAIPQAWQPPSLQNLNQRQRPHFACLPDAAASFLGDPWRKELASFLCFQQAESEKQSQLCCLCPNRLALCPMSAGSRCMQKVADARAGGHRH